jgi:acyl-CoA synthetase (AMP-forming)/AMP-acid ligase II
VQSIIHRDSDPPRVEFSAHGNAAHDLLSRNQGWPSKPAYVQGDDGQVLSHAELDRQARCWASALQAEGFEPEQRVLLAMHDTLEWPVAFLGCILAGVVPIAVNTRLTGKDFEFMLRDSRAKGLIASMLAHPQRPNANELALRVCTRAREALPAEIGHHWQKAYGCDIPDGIGSTEMSPSFLSNRPGQVRHGTTGQAVPGYEPRLIDVEDRAGSKSSTNCPRLQPGKARDSNCMPLVHNHPIH